MTDEILDNFAGQLRVRLGDHLKQLILFGSRARGDADPDSDYDCLVVVDEVTDDVKSVTHEVAADILYEYSVVFSAFPISARRFAEDKYEPLLMNVRKEGVTVEAR